MILFTLFAKHKVFHVPPVNEQVCRKSAAALEALSTLFALEHLFRAVDRPEIDYYVMFCLSTEKVAEDYNEDECCVRGPGNVCKCIN